MARSRGSSGSYVALFINLAAGTVTPLLADRTSTDIERKLESFREYFDQARSHRSLNEKRPISPLLTRGTPDSIVMAIITSFRLPSPQCFV